MNKNRFKNPYFWLGLIGVMGAAAGINAETLTSWNALFTSVMEVVKNPYVLGCTLFAALGVFTDPTTKGLKDGLKK